VIRFADVSHYQGDVDLAAYMAAGHDRIALKVSEGTGFVDPAFAGRYRWLRDHNKPALLYHYDRAKFSGIDQFDFFLTAIATVGPPRDFDLLCLDSEDTSFPLGARRSATEFTTRAVQRGYPMGCVYTGKWYADPNRITADAVAQGWRQLWLSDYRESVADDAIPLPVGWTRSQVLARQYTPQASVPGVGGACDYNRLFLDWATEVDMPLSDEDRTWLRKLVLDRQEAILDAVKTIVPRGQLMVLTGAPNSVYNAEEAAGFEPTAIGPAVANLTAQVINLAARLDETRPTVDGPAMSAQEVVDEMARRLAA
jgi:GH25 family lysozyme M1 (1,4-beta-N-acetylmuramidase)